MSAATERTGDGVNAADERWIESARLILAEMPIGSRVTVAGGFENGIRGYVIGVRRRTDTGPYCSDYPVFYVETDNGSRVGGLSVDQLEPIMADTGCLYCGPGLCRGSAFTTDGRDLERFARLHPRERVRDVTDLGYLLECYACGCWGSLDLFGLGNARQCPGCGSLEVHAK